METCNCHLSTNVHNGVCEKCLLPLKGAVFAEGGQLLNADELIRFGSLDTTQQDILNSLKELITQIKMLNEKTELIRQDVDSIERSHGHKPY